MWILGDLIDSLLSGERGPLLLDLLRDIEEEPSLHGANSHLLAVAKSPT